MLQYNWWQSLLAGILILGTGLAIGHFVWKAPTQGTTTIYIPGKNIIRYIPQEPLIGHDTKPSTSNNRVSTPIDTSYHFDVPEDIHFFEMTTDTTLKDSTHVVFRSRTYVYNNDSAQTIHEWAITPKPLEENRQIDTIVVKQPVPVPMEQSLIAKPEFAYPVGIIVGIIAAILIKK